MAYESVMKERDDVKDETSHLLPGYDDIFPQQETRHARDGYDIDEVRKGGSVFDDQYKQRQFATRSGSAGQAEKSMQIGLCCFAIFAVAVVSILSYVLFRTSFRLYSELVSGWDFLWSGTITQTGILEYLTPLLLLVLMLVLVVLIGSCIILMALPLWEKPNEVGKFEKVGKLGLCCTCFCGTTFWVLLILGFLSFYTGSSGAYRASNTICRVYKSNTMTSCPLHFHTVTQKVVSPITGRVSSEVQPGAQVTTGQEVANVVQTVIDKQGGRRLELPSVDIDLDLVDFEEDGDRKDASLSPALRARHSGRRLADKKILTPDHDKARAFLTKNRSGPTDCADVEELCRTEYKNFTEATACVCSGLPVNQPGEYCKIWGGSSADDPGRGKTPWCSVLPTTVCGKKYDKVSGKSTGPCVGPTETKYDAVYHGKQMFLLSLIASSVAAFCCCCNFCCGVYLNGQKARAGAHARVATRRGKDVGNNDKKLFQPGALTTTQGASAFERNVKLMPIEEEFRYYQEEASLRLSDSTPDATRYELYGFYHQAVQGNVQGERPSFFHHDDQMKYDAWARLKGMPRNEAMRGYCNAVKRLAPPAKSTWGGAE